MSFEKVLALTMGIVYVCDAQKTTMAATDVVSINAAAASVLSELESVSSLKEEQRTTLNIFLDGKDVFTLLPTGFIRF